MKNLLKGILSIGIGILIFVGTFMLDAKFINWIISGFSNPHWDLAMVVKIALWVVTFSVTFGIGLFLGALVSSLLISYFFD